MAWVPLTNALSSLAPWRIDVEGIPDGSGEAMNTTDLLDDMQGTSIYP